MQSYLLTARSLTYAQKYIKILQKKGISASLARTPAGLSETGCGYSVKVSERNLISAVNLLEEYKFFSKKVFKIISDNRYERIEF